MGKEANLRQKSHKLPVMLYRAFLTLSMAGAVYAAYSVLSGSEISDCSIPISVALIGAIMYEIVYCVYKADQKSNNVPNVNALWIQVAVLLKLLGYFAGLFSLIYGAHFVRDGKYFGIALMLIGLVFCQQLHNNKWLFSHLSTFFENLAIAFVVITLELMLTHIGEGGNKWYWVVSALLTVVFYILSEMSFHFYNLKKHKGKEKKRTLVLDRVAQCLSNVLTVGIIWTAWALLIISGGVQFAIDVGIYDKAIAVIPLIISAGKAALEIYKKTRSAELDVKKYDPRISISEFKNELKKNFGEKARSIKALDYVTEKMSRKNGMVRYNGEDYFVHPIAVAKLLIDNTNADDDTVTAAILHDCIEDIEDCTYETIKEEYNENIAELVRLVSKKKDVDYDIPANKQEYISNICTSIPATMIKIADRLNNISTMDNRTDEDKAAKSKETRDYYKALVYSAMPRDGQNRSFYRMAEEHFDKEIK